MADLLTIDNVSLTDQEIHEALADALLRKAEKRKERKRKREGAGHVIRVEVDGVEGWSWRSRMSGRLEDGRMYETAEAAEKALIRHAARFDPGYIGRRSPVASRRRFQLANFDHITEHSCYWCGKALTNLYGLIAYCPCDGGPYFFEWPNNRHLWRDITLRTDHRGIVWSSHMLSFGWDEAMIAAWWEQWHDDTTRFRNSRANAVVAGMVAARLGVPRCVMERTKDHEHLMVIPSEKEQRRATPYYCRVTWGTIRTGYGATMWQFQNGYESECERMWGRDQATWPREMTSMTTQDRRRDEIDGDDLPLNEHMDNRLWFPWWDCYADEKRAQKLIDAAHKASKKAAR